MSRASPRAARRPDTGPLWPPARMIHEVGYADLPATVVTQAKRCFLDLIGVAAAGSTTPVAAIAARYAVDHMGSASKPVRLLLDGRCASPAGAAFVGATTIDSIDAHDGLAAVKGHVGVTVLPTLLAMAELGLVSDGRDLLTSLVLGYEIGNRSGLALHRSVVDYHTSGAWGALAAAALVARHLRLSQDRTRHALGAAEYYGPRSQMMRCIAHPAMVKDGSGWGAFVGVTSALLAAEGFTGAPAITVDDSAVADLWSDLGRRWLILELYFKPYPVCRWAQPALDAVQALQSADGFTADDITDIEVTSFQEAISLTTREPDDTESAQYSLPFPVAVYLVYGKLGASEITGAALRNPAVLRLSRAMKMVHSPAFQTLFPAERWAQVAVGLRDGRTLRSAPTMARGDPAQPMSNPEMLGKYHDLADGVLGKTRAAAIEAEIDRLDQANAPLTPLLDLLHRSR